MYKLHTTYRQLLADTVTPVSIYLRIRDRYAQTVLLESSDYRGNTNTYSFICFDPMSEVKVENNVFTAVYPDNKVKEVPLGKERVLPSLMQEFLNEFEVDELDMKFVYSGLFGYQTYDIVRHYEDIEIKSFEDDERRVPEILYHVYRYMIVVNHFNNEMFVFEHRLDGEESNLDAIIDILSNPTVPSYHFELHGEETTNFTDEEFLDVIEKGRHHCQMGDVFQIVLSRRFQQGFRGDEFNVYRALRSVNPSPYLFYCDYGSFKLMGSSPEAQLIIKDGQATIHPIAGTFRRTGNDEEDARLSRELFDDPKENAEHVMLVDLARNDLSRHGHDVEVATFKEIQFYSHVIHLVSKVDAQIGDNTLSMELVGDTFPAGTLAGAPKHRAMQLINEYEPQNRGYYAGCIGYMDFKGNFNHAIMIRSFLSKQNVLYYHAGAGIVSRSVPASELQEVHNKLGALRKAMNTALEINKGQKQLLNFE
ncbi:MAG: chorismate-binding protein [Bacteroidota bacterium]